MNDISEQRDAAVEAVRRSLQNTIRDSGVTQREVELRNGYKKGYLSQVLKGHIALTLRHALGILLALDVDPATFFLRSLGSEEISEIREQMARYDVDFTQVYAAIDEVRQIALQTRKPDGVDSDDLSSVSAASDSDDDLQEES